jgi:type I restriction enzyme M protein
VVFNGSPLFSGDAGSGMSEIRRWIIESDWLDAIIGLPDQLFYNTGISTYVWVVTNRKRPERQGKVQLVDARELFAKMPKSLGNKRNELTPAHIADITALYEDFTEGDRSKILPNSAFGYRKVTVERPLRARYEINAETTALVVAGKTFAKLDDATQTVLREVLENLDGTSATTIEQLEKEFVPEAIRVWAAHDWPTEEGATGDLAWSLGITKPQAKAILADLTVSDPDGDPVTDRKGVVQPDPSLRDNENVPLDEDVDAFIQREVLPYAPDAWVDDTKTKIGYEIPFTRHFYKYVPPRPLAEIDADIKASQQRILALLAEVTE